MALLTTSRGCRRSRLALGWRVAWLVALTVLGGMAPAASAQPATPAEYQVKAAFLFKLTQFVEWPARAFRDGDSPLVIGILGEDPFGAYLDELVKGEKLGSRPLVVRRFNRVEDITDCQILFISRSETATLEKSLAQLKGRSVLTVGDADTFTQQGGMVRFSIENGKVRLKISVANIEADKASGLKPSSTILSPATIVPLGKD